ncbi:hypothetical protein DMUE_4427 [Dictyocoela muelleri]|nr:hypothetical protein DMUE_4427 [Dictyocoela muelleri]
MIDTGSAENYIQEHVAKRNNLEVRDLEIEKTVRVANRSTVQIRKFCILTFQIMNNDNISYKTRFLILPNPSEILILGMRFFSDNDAIINIKDKYIALDGTEYDLENR